NTPDIARFRAGHRRAAVVSAGATGDFRRRGDSAHAVAADGRLVHTYVAEGGVARSSGSGGAQAPLSLHRYPAVEHAWWGGERHGDRDSTIPALCAAERSAAAEPDCGTDRSCLRTRSRPCEALSHAALPCFLCPEHDAPGIRDQKPTAK